MAAQQEAFPRFQRRTHSAAVAEVHMQLKPGPEAAGEGRHALDRFSAKLDEIQLGELRLLVTELLTNSVRHGARTGGWISLDVELYVQGLRVVVANPGRGFKVEHKPQPHPDRPGGWGLCLVDRLADRWGVDSDGETAVWFEIDRSGGDFANAA
jgi:anti-sigma regulatory factor (Ser/Thr protein kinase)